MEVNQRMSSYALERGSTDKSIKIMGHAEDGMRSYIGSKQ